MSQEDNSSKKGAAENFSEMFKAFGNAVSEIFNDPELKAKAKEFGNSVAESAKTFPSRFKDEEVKNKFRDVGKAARDFGRSVADTFRDKDDDSGKSVEPPEYGEPPPSPE
ncbi:MAG: hypothetical protein KAI14_01645 [Dehalococcoidales bacterium]|nr:hypothetical protein [Dehalococcoidales bacterium]